MNNISESLAIFKTTGYTVLAGIVPSNLIDDVNNKVDLLVPHRAHGLDHKYYPHGKLDQCPKLGIWWSQQVTDWPEIQKISQILINRIGSLFSDPAIYVADIITNEPGNTFVKPHIDSPYRFPEWWDSDELLGIQCILPLCDFTEANGGTGILPGSHTKRWVVKDSYAGVYNEEFMAGMIQPAMGPGDVLAYHPRILHSTMPNRTDTARRALLIHVTDRSMIEKLVKVDNIWLEGSK